MKEPSTGGSEGGGGTVASGGAQSTGGSTGGPGGQTSSGGNRASGGATASGGSVASGGNGTSPASGGSGGTTGTGAATSPGGAGGSGGTKATGGAGAAGGVRGSGGITASAGGSSGGGTCTDDPPPNQTPTCSEWVSYNVCTQDWFKTYCNRSCARCTGGNPSGSGGISSAGGVSNRGGAGGSGGEGATSGKGGSTGGGGTTGPGNTNPQITGSSGWASRYWDCCKPSCSWTTNVPACQKDGTTRIGDKNAQSGCSGGSAYECYDLSPWYDSATNMSYGFAAHNGNCGVCYMLQFTGDGHSGTNAGAAALKGQQMIVQAINIGNIAGDQFDLLIPGGGVGAMNGCSTQWGSSTDLGAQYGGLLTNCKGDPTCMKGKCQSVFGSMPALLAGCNWFTGWYSSADNPNLVYKQVSCPSQITSKSGVSG